MKGEIKKLRGAFRIGFKIVFHHPDGHNMDYMFVPEGYIDEFMDDIYSQYLKKKHRLLNLIERTATEAVKARKDFLRSEKERAYEEGFKAGYGVGCEQINFNVKYDISKERRVITPEEEAEQDEDELLIEKYKTYDNIIDKDLEYFEKD